MYLGITHETRYHYQPAVGTAMHIAHMKPRDTQHQRLLSHQLNILPETEHKQDVLDVFGNTSQYFSLQTVHPELVVTARSVVETDNGPPPALEESQVWESVRAHFRYRAGVAFDPANEFVFPSPYVPWAPEFAAFARPEFQSDKPLFLAVQGLMQKIHREFKYDPKSTEVSTPALEALRQRKGVCQDFAHIMIACCRNLGLPARYVSGYLLTEPPPGQPRLIGNDATHAWVSVYDPQQGLWLDFDPTNNRLLGEDYVTVAWGRDFGDVSPMRGVIHGGANHTLEVAVTVEPLKIE